MTASSRSRATGLSSSGPSYDRSSYVTASSRSQASAITSSGPIYDPSSPYDGDSDKTYRRQLSYSTASSVSGSRGGSSSVYDPSSSSDDDADESTYRRQSTSGGSRSVTSTVSYSGGNPAVRSSSSRTPSYQRTVSSDPGTTGQSSSGSGRNDYATDKDGNPIPRPTSRTSGSIYASRCKFDSARRFISIFRSSKIYTDIQRY